MAQQAREGSAGPQGSKPEQYPVAHGSLESLQAVVEALRRLATKKPVGRPKGKTYDESRCPAAAALRADLRPMVRNLARARLSGDIDGLELQQALSKIVERIAPDVDAKRAGADLAKSFLPPESRSGRDRRRCRPPRDVLNDLVHLAYPDLPKRVIARLNPKN